MRSGQIYDRCKHSLAKLKKQWTRLIRTTLLALADEELRLRSKELEKQLGTHRRNVGAQGPSQARGDWDV